MGLSKTRILFTNKRLLFMGIAFFLLTIILVIIVANKEVIIHLDGKESSYSFTGKQTVGEVLAAKDIILKEEDKVEPSLDTVMKDGENINIERAVPIVVIADSKEYQFLSTETKVKDIVQQLNIEIGDLDIVEPDINSTLDPDDKSITIVRVEEKYESDTAILKYKNIVKKNSKMDKGKMTLVQRGSNGVKTIKEKVILHDGVVVSRDVINETITKKPVDQVKEVGTNTLIATSRGNKNFTKTINVIATGYCPDVGNRTASGTTPKANRTIAASRQFSFGTNLYIPELKGKPSGGVYRVEDRGGDIQGNRIDIFFSTHSEAVKFGRRTIKAYVLE